MHELLYSILDSVLIKCIRLYASSLFKRHHSHECRPNISVVTVYELKYYMWACVVGALI